MKSFKTYLLENNLFLILEHKEWHQLVKQFGDKIIDQYGLGYEKPTGDEKDVIPHKTEFIKTKLGLGDIPKHHGRWILGQVIKGKIPNPEDIASTIIPNLAKFEEHKDRHGINLSKVNNQTELFNIVQKHAPEESNLDVKAGTDYTLHGENEHWKVIEPHTEAAACAFGSGTNWCTASKTNSLFRSYSRRGPMHILIPKKPLYKGEKYQYHQQSNQFMNNSDEPVNRSDDKKQLSLIDRPLPEIDSKLKFDLEFRTATTNKDTPEKHLLKLIEHPNFGSTLGHISKLVNSEHPSVAIAAIKHPRFGSEVKDITVALGSRHKSVAEAAANHPRFGDDDDHITTALGSEHQSVAEAAANHPRFANITRSGNTLNHINIALSSPHKSVAEAAIKHPLFGKTIDHITMALSSPHESVAQAAIQNPSFGRSAMHMGIALNSPHESVAKAATKDESFGDGDRLEIAFRSKHESVAKAAVNHPSFGRLPYLIPRALRSKYLSVAEAAANHPRFGDELTDISVALESPHKSVAEAAIKHRTFGKTIDHVITALRSPHESVKNAGIEQLSLRRHPTLVGKSLEDLVNYQ